VKALTIGGQKSILKYRADHADEITKTKKNDLSEISQQMNMDLASLTILWTLKRVDPGITMTEVDENMTTEEFVELTELITEVNNYKDKGVSEVKSPKK
jgi:hypothetical protein